MWYNLYRIKGSNYMKKLLLFILLLIPLSAYALELPETYSDVVLIYDLTDDQVLLEKNSEKKSNIASLTKIMTTITAIELNSDLSKKVTITDEMLNGIPWDASIAHLTVGTTYTFEDLLYASILPSGADATQSLAVSTSGSVANFVKEMNNLAKRIGVINTNFVNVTGLDVDNHYSNAKDILTILKYALSNPTFKKIYCTKEYLLTNNQKVESTINMYTRKINLDVSKIKGSKTGYTSKSGTCISALTDIYDHEVVVITLHAPYSTTDAYNLRDAVKLINFIEDNYSYQPIIHKDAIVKTIPVELSKVDSYDIKTTSDILRFLPKDYNKDLVTMEYKGEESLDYNTHTGAELGKITYYYNGEVIGSEDVTLTITIEPDVLKIINKYRLPIIFVGCIIVLLIICICLLTRKSKKHKKKKQ